MTQPTKKTSSKDELLWNRFEKSGSIQAYLRFQKARLGTEGEELKRPKSGVRAKAKKA
jgi:hypothetical protein